MASLIPLGFLTFLDANGDPLAGGSVGYYDPASSGTLKPIFADSAETVPVTNPVPLDAAGRPFSGGSEVGIWGDGQFRMIVNDFNGALQWSAITASPLSVTGGTINGDLTVNGTFTNTGNSNITGNLSVNGTSTLQSVVINAGSASLEDVFVSHSLAVPGLLSAVDINASGNVNIGGTLDAFGPVNISKDLVVAGTSSLEGAVTTGSTLNVFDVGTFQNRVDVTGDLNSGNNIKANGQVTALGPMNASAFNVVSDRRLKTTTIRDPATSTLQAIAGIPVHHGAYKSAPHELKPIILADEVQQIMPWAVNGAPDATAADGSPIYQSVNMVDLVILLMGALKEMLGRVETLENLVTTGKPQP